MDLPYPLGILADRYGTFNRVGLGLDYYPKKGNWVLGLNSHLLFGTNVKEDVLAPLRTAEGFIYGNDKSIAEIRMRSRGWYIGGNIGKAIPLSVKNPRAGLLIRLGAGILQHKVRIQDDPERQVPQLSEERKPGYDRLTNGLGLYQFFGYQQLDLENRINFYFGIEVIEGVTQLRRNFQFDTLEANTSNRLDLLIGIKLGWILPFYLNQADKIFY